MTSKPRYKYEWKVIRKSNKRKVQQDKPSSIFILIRIILLNSLEFKIHAKIIINFNEFITDDKKAKRKFKKKNENAKKLQNMPRNKTDMKLKPKKKY